MVENLDVDQYLPEEELVELLGLLEKQLGLVREPVDVLGRVRDAAAEVLLVGLLAHSVTPLSFADEHSRYRTTPVRELKTSQ